MEEYLDSVIGVIKDSIQVTKANKGTCELVILFKEGRIRGWQVTDETGTKTKVITEFD